MNADLEATLKELGKEYRPVVDRLRAGREVEPRRSPAHLRLPRSGWRIARIAASLAVIAGGAALLLNLRMMTPRGPQQAANPIAEQNRTVESSVPAASPPRTPYELALAEDGSTLQEILRTQSADGSWANDVLTRQNAAALREADATSVAYRKAVRYLRTKGLAPLSADELHRLQRNARRV